MGKRTEKFKQARLDAIENLTNELVADKQAISELAELQKEALAEFTNKTNEIMSRCDYLTQALSDKIQKLEDEAKFITNEPLTEEHFEGEYNTLRKQVEDAYASVRMFQAPVEKDNETKPTTGEVASDTGKEETKVETVTNPVEETKVEPVVEETPVETKEEPVAETPVEQTKVETVVEETPVETKVETVVEETPVETKVEPVEETKTETVTNPVEETPVETKVEPVAETKVEPGVKETVADDGPEMITEESFTIDDDSLYEDILTDNTSAIVEPLTENSTTLEGDSVNREDVVEPLTENSTTLEGDDTDKEDVITVIESTPVDNKPNTSSDVPTSFADLLNRAASLNI